MLETTIGWDWFYEQYTDEERTAMEEGRLCAVVREDGDDNAAIVEAVQAIQAPAEHTRLVTYNPCVGDCFLAVAWDTRTVDCKPLDDEDGGWCL